jgi:hypothetical protein
MSPRLPLQHKVRGLPGHSALRLALALSIAGLLTGCPPEEWNLQPVEAPLSAIRFDHRDFDPDLAEYELDHEHMTGNEAHVARFFGPDAFALLLVYKAGPRHVIPEHSTETRVARMVDGIELDWGESGRVPTRMGHVRYRMFRFTGEPFSCLGFSQTVGETPDDKRRKRNLIAGYFCYDETRPPSAATAADLIGKVSLSR